MESHQVLVATDGEVILVAPAHNRHRAAVTSDVRDRVHPEWAENTHEANVDIALGSATLVGEAGLDQTLVAGRVAAMGMLA